MSTPPFHHRFSEEKQRIEAWFKELQKTICTSLESFEISSQTEHPPSFITKEWNYEGQGPSEYGGGGISAHLRGNIFEKAAVHFSAVWGEFSEEFRASVRGAHEEPRFYATGLSLIVHPYSPHIPTVHFNTRFLITSCWWFGGGADLTPMLNLRRTQEDPDTLLFHEAMRQACSNPPCADYEQYKTDCDAYFFLPHRKEIRGIGGIFFDPHHTGNWADDFSFIQEVGKKFSEVYPKIVSRNLLLPFSADEKKEQLIRRGRYVEFNLLYDRGTLFGLKTGGNIDTILSSMPPEAHWP